MAERKYTDQEVAQILKRATEARGAHLAKRRNDDGLTLEQIKSIGDEVGIARSRIEEAARTLVAFTYDGESHLLLGTPATVQFESQVSAQPGDAQLNEVLRMIRTATAKDGIVEERFGGMEWTTRSALGKRYVDLVPTVDGGRIRVMGDFRGAGRAGAVVTTAAALVGSGATSVAVAVLGAIGWLAAPVAAVAAVALPRLTLGRMVLRESRILARLSEDITRVAQGPPPADDHPSP